MFTRRNIIYFPFDNVNGGSLNIKYSVPRRSLSDITIFVEFMDRVMSNFNDVIGTYFLSNCQSKLYVGNDILNFVNHGRGKLYYSDCSNHVFFLY